MGQSRCTWTNAGSKPGVLAVEQRGRRGLPLPLACTCIIGRDRTRRRLETEGVTYGPGYSYHVISSRAAVGCLA